MMLTREQVWTTGSCVSVVITSVLADQLGSEASQPMSAPCPLRSADELRALMHEAGFRDVELRVDVLPMRVSALEEFLSGQFAASPIAAEIEARDEDDRLAFFDELQRLLHPYTDDAGLAVPFEAHLVCSSLG